MSNIQAQRVEKPPFFRIVPTRRGRGNRKVHVTGFDTEAIGGVPRLIQFNHSGNETETIVNKLSHHPRAALRAFIEYLDTYCTRKDTEYIIVGWNLAYEWTQLFRNLPDIEDTSTPLVALPEFTFDTGREDEAGEVKSRWRVKVLNDKRYTATFTHLGTKRRVRVIDGMAFYVTSLNNAATMLGLEAKIKLPNGFWDRRLTDDDFDTPWFRQYARQDAYLTRRIGENIVDLFAEYDVPTCVSAPQFAARVFRHHFLDGEIPLPSPDLEQAGLYSYHGGKNGYYLGGPKHLSNLWSFDITSAYPEAMRAIPNPVTAQWYPVEDWQPGRHALYRVTMELKACRYKGLQAHDGSKMSTGYVDGVWTTSYELDAIMAHGEARLIAVSGYEMVGEGGGPLVDYVDRFFALKARSTGPTREAAKLFLNSLYGKFFQKVPQGDTGFWLIDGDEEPRLVENDGAYDWTAGGLYHPPIASLITGYVRARIHGLEHKYTSVMTSTDGFFARRKPDPSDLGKHLGGLTATKGDLSIWRERLYIFTNPNDPKPKAALHGFRGDVAALRVIPLVPGATEYTARQLVTLRLAGREFTAPDGGKISPGAGTIPTLKYVLDIRGSPM